MGSTLPYPLYPFAICLRYAPIATNPVVVGPTAGFLMKTRQGGAGRVGVTRGVFRTRRGSPRHKTGRPSVPALATALVCRPAGPVSRLGTPSLLLKHPRRMLMALTVRGPYERRPALRAKKGADTSGISRIGYCNGRRQSTQSSADRSKFNERIQSDTAVNHSLTFDSFYHKLLQEVPVAKTVFD